MRGVHLRNISLCATVELSVQIVLHEAYISHNPIREPLVLCCRYSRTLELTYYLYFFSHLLHQIQNIFFSIAAIIKNIFA